MPCLNPKQIINPRYKEGGYKKRLIYCRDYFGFDNSILMSDPLTGSLSWYPPDYYIKVPCGMCAECKRIKRNGWSIRILHESRCHKHSAFVTLTLSPSSLKRFEKCPKEPLKLYIDRLRKSLGFRPRYIFVPELGDDTERLHYHGIIFGAEESRITYNAIKKAWKYGIVTVSGLTDKRCSYVSKYMLKQTKDFKAFVMCSNGIGKSYVTEANAIKHLNGFDPKLYIDFNGCKYSLPAYYKDKFFSPEIKAILLVNRLNDSSPFEKVFHGHIFNDEYSYQKALTSFYDWTLRQGLSNTEDIIPQELKLFNPFKQKIDYGTVCFSESRACRYSAEQARFEFVQTFHSQRGHTDSYFEH